MAGCSQDDVTTMGTPDEAVVTTGERVAISFSCLTDDDAEANSSDKTAPEGATHTDQNTTRTTIGYTGEMASEDLYYTGFGVFASQNADAIPDMMYNQQVKFTFVGDLTNPLRGFWSYSPLKYWPTQGSLDHFSVCAYAPYIELPDEVSVDDKGIVGISKNNEAPYIDYRLPLTPEEHVDLLWCYEQPRAIPEGSATHPAGTLNMKLHHALARVEVNVKVESLPENTKVLIERIELSGNTAMAGRLTLNAQTTTSTGNETEYFPVWTNLTYNGTNREITIANTATGGNYGIIDPKVRYVAELPYQWQSEGVSDTYCNALYAAEHQTYIYLIPQPSLTLTCRVTYRVMTPSTNSQQTTSSTIVMDNKEIKGNTPYRLNLILTAP